MRKKLIAMLYFLALIHVLNCCEAKSGPSTFGQPKECGADTICKKATGIYAIRHI